MTSIYKTLDLHIGQALKDFRETAQLSRAYVSNQIGCSSADLERFESGQARIGAMDLYKAAKCLGVEINAFFETPNPSIASNSCSAHSVPGTPAALIEALRAHRALRKLVDDLDDQKDIHPRVARVA